MIDYSTIMSHFHSRTDSHNSGRAQLCFFWNISSTGEPQSIPKFPGQDPRKRPAVPPAWNAGPGVKPPGGPTPRQLGTFHG